MACDGVARPLSDACKKSGSSVGRWHNKVLNARHVGRCNVGQTSSDSRNALASDGEVPEEEEEEEEEEGERARAAR